MPSFANYSSCSKHKVKGVSFAGILSKTIIISHWMLLDGDTLLQKVCWSLLFGERQGQNQIPTAHILCILCIICSPLADWTAYEINLIRNLVLNISDQKNGLWFETPDTKPLSKGYRDCLTSPRWFFVSVSLETVIRSVFALQFKLYSDIFKAVLSHIPHSFNTTMPAGSLPWGLIVVLECENIAALAATGSNNILLLKGQYSTDE